jgi:hypothetical protein
MAQNDSATRDKDELVRALYSRLELAKHNREVDRSDDAGDESADPSSTRGGDGGGGGGGGGTSNRLGAAEALQTARARQAELHGANAALRGRCQELDGEIQVWKGTPSENSCAKSALSLANDPTLTPTR